MRPTAPILQGTKFDLFSSLAFTHSLRTRFTNSLLYLSYTQQHSELMNVLQGEHFTLLNKAVQNDVVLSPTSG